MGLFREKAIQAYLDPDTQGGVLRVVPPSLLRLFGVLAVVFVVALVASVVIRVKVTARGRGIVRPGTGIVVVRAPSSGYVRVIQVDLGQRVRAGEVLARLDGPVLAPTAGVVDAIPVHLDEFVAAGTPIAKIIPADGDLVGFLAVPSRYRAYLHRDQFVRLAFEEYPYAEMGFGAGHIRRVSDDIVSHDLARTFLGDDPLSGPHFLVEVVLDEMPPRADGQFHNGMPFEGMITLRRRRVATLVLQPLRELLRD